MPWPLSTLAHEIQVITARAQTWPVTVEFRSTEGGHARGEDVPQAHLTCGECGQSVFCLSPDTRDGFYLATVETITAGIASHLRISHES
jgi:hypothetical protein